MNSSHGNMMELDKGHFVCIYCDKELLLTPEYKVLNKGDPKALHTATTKEIEITNKIEGE